MYKVYVQPTAEQLKELPVFHPNVTEEDMKLMTVDGDEPVFYKVFQVGENGELLPPMSKRNDVVYQPGEWWPLHEAPGDTPSICQAGMIHVTTNPIKWAHGTYGNEPFQTIAYRVVVKNLIAPLSPGTFACEAVTSYGSTDKHVVSTGRTIGDPLTWEEVLEIDRLHHKHNSALIKEYDERREEIQAKRKAEAEAKRVAKILAASKIGKIYVDRDTDVPELLSNLFEVANCPHCDHRVDAIEYKREVQEVVYNTHHTILNISTKETSEEIGNSEYGDSEDIESHLEYDCGCSVESDDFEEILEFDAFYDFRDLVEQYLWA